MAKTLDNGKPIYMKCWTCEKPVDGSETGCKCPKPYIWKPGVTLD